MDTVVSHVKRIELDTGVTHIMTVGEAIDRIGEHPQAVRDNLEKYGSLKVNRDLYHVLDREKSMVEILGRSIAFELRDGEKILVKVQGVGFMGVVAGYDTEGMPVHFNLDQVSCYYIPGVVAR